jgi:hypothetical protein
MKFKVEEKKLIEAIKSKEAIEILKESNAIIAGGAITSLFTKQPINDLDIYFRSYEDLEVFVRLACDGEVEDKDAWEHFKVKEKDVHCGDFGSYTLIHNGLTTKSCLFTTHQRDQFEESTKLQLIHFAFYKSPKEIFKTFDFTINMAAYDFKYQEFIFHEDFLKDLSQRSLVVNTATAFPMISVVRVDKYKQRGFEISRKELFKLLVAVNKVKITSWKELRAHLGGLYGATDTNLFDDSKEFSLDEAIEQLINLESQEFDPSFVRQSMSSRNILRNIQIEHKMLEPQLTFYKFVTKNQEGSLVSYYQSGSFQLTYKVQEFINGGPNGIYCCETLKGVKDYHKGKTNVILKLTIKDPAQAIYGAGEIRLLGNVFVEAIIPKDQE